MTKITFENLPSTNTPVNASNLNTLQDNVETAINNVTIFKKYNFWPTSSNKKLESDISVNGGAGGKTVIAIVSGHNSNADNTFSSIFMLRCGYDGNHLTSTKVSENANSNVGNGGISFSVSTSNTIQLNTIWGSGNIAVMYIINK